MKELSEIKKWDAEDSLARYRSHFVHSQEEIYMDGNSLGKLPLETKKRWRRPFPMRGVNG